MPQMRNTKEKKAEKTIVSYLIKARESREEGRKEMQNLAGAASDVQTDEAHVLRERVKLMYGVHDLCRFLGPNTSSPRRQPTAKPDEQVKQEDHYHA